MHKRGWAEVLLLLHEQINFKFTVAITLNCGGIKVSSVVAIG